MAGRLEGKVAVVTGASTGIGRSVMKRFAEEGARVLGVARSEERLRDAREEVEAACGQGVCATVSADLVDDEGAARAIDAVTAEFGGLDILVNNAGVGYAYKAVRPKSMEPVDSSTPEEWDHVMSINLGSAVNCTRRAITAFRERGAGSIVNVASVLGLRGQPDAHAYTTAKGGMVNFTRSVAITYAKEQIRCNVLCPGYIETPMVEEYREFLSSEDYRWQWNPMGRMGLPDEIANGVLFLASDEASYTNGAVLTIDGGMTAKML